jgi:hypothetical protein
MSRHVRRASLCVVVAIVAVVNAVAGQANNPQIGVWKANIARSTFASGPAVKSTTTTFEVVAEGVKGTVDAAYPDGTTMHWGTITQYGGSETRILGKSPHGETAAMTRIGADTVKTVYKQGGKVTVTQTSVVSADGKTRTVTSTGTSAQGQPIESVLFYEKQ